MTKKNKKTIWFGLIISLFFFLVFVFTKDVGQNTIEPISTVASTTTSIPKENIKKAFLVINGRKLEEVIKKNDTIYDFMTRIKEKKSLDFKSKTYSGMGKLIKEINGIKSKGNKYWIYYVNGKKANVGVSNYKIKTGDVVSWKYQSF